MKIAEISAAGQTICALRSPCSEGYLHRTPAYKPTRPHSSQLAREPTNHDTDQPHRGAQAARLAAFVLLHFMVTPAVLQYDSVATVYGYPMGEPASSLLGLFISASAAFGKLVAWLNNENRKSRERIATYFDQIAVCMREVAERIEAGNPPRDTCRRLAVYADELQRILSSRDYQLAIKGTSAEVTSERLIEKIEQTRITWIEADEARARTRFLNSAELENTREEAARRLIRRVKDTAMSNSGVTIHEGQIDHLTSQLEDEFTNSNVQENVQQIWDAAGEFAALADALRAR